MRNSLKKVKMSKIFRLFSLKNVLNSSLPDVKNEIQDTPSTKPVKKCKSTRFINTLEQVSTRCPLIRKSTKQFETGFGAKICFKDLRGCLLLIPEALLLLLGSMMSTLLWEEEGNLAVGHEVERFSTSFSSTKNFSTL